MKIIQTTLLFSLLFFFACRNAGEASTKTDHTTTAASEVEHESAHTGTLSLNNGEKWKADANTQAHAAKLNTLVAGFDVDAASVADYHSYAAALQSELDSLISDCKMKGADHEALHLWLMQVLEDVKNLKKVSAPGAGKEVAEQLAADVQKFNIYFQ